MSTPIRLVVGIVGAVLLLCVAGIIALAVMSTSIPDVLQNVAVGCVGLLGGLLVPASPKGKP